MKETKRHCNHFQCQRPYPAGSASRCAAPPCRLRMQGTNPCGLANSCQQALTPQEAHLDALHFFVGCADAAVQLAHRAQVVAQALQQ